MIKYFRKIRRNLLSESKFSSYLIYAIGEILLVVIGILIALWINNLNQQKKNLRIEKVYFEEFLLDLKEDVRILDSSIASNNKRIAQIDTITQVLSRGQSLPKADWLQFVSRHILLTTESYFIPQKTTIRQLESGSHGRIIQNKELRTKLFKYYNANDRNEQNNEVSIQIYMHHFNTPNLLDAVIDKEALEAYSSLPFDIRSQNINSLLKNDDYLKALFLRRGNADTQNRGYIRMKKLAEELIEMLED